MKTLFYPFMTFFFMFGVTPKTHISFSNKSIIIIKARKGVRHLHQFKSNLFRLKKITQHDSFQKL